MEENKNNKAGAEDDKNMARGEQAPLDPVSVAPEDSELISRSLMPPPQPSTPPSSTPPRKKKPLQQQQQQQVEEPGQHMVTLKPKFLPNLKGLMFPKMVYEQAKRLVITPLLAYPHDPVAALKLRGVRCASFELPKDMFPRGAPIWKITFLPQELLPMGFDAGGVFGTGVLARKYYPTDLLSADHKGQTPPLFIGHRSSSYILPKAVNAQAKCNGKGKGQGQGQGHGQGQGQHKRIQPLTPAPPPSPAFVRSILKPSAAVAAEMNRLLILHNISVLEMVIMPAFRKSPPRYPIKVPIQMQYNMYAPDMSKVIFAMQDISLFTVAIISTVHHPNVPEVALSTMGNEPCPKFELPVAIFPADTNRMGPRFLPQRFLPDFCDAGCVFAPGSLPDSVFQGALRKHYDLAQHHYSMTPPLFVGRRKPLPLPESDNEAIQVYRIDSIALQLKRLALRNIEATTKQNSSTTVPVPESTKRSNEFKTSVAAGKPKGFVLIESDHVPRGAIQTDFFGAFLMGCFFKITPYIKCLYDSSTESEEDGQEQNMRHMQYMRDAKEQTKTVLTEDKAIQAQVPEAERMAALNATKVDYGAELGAAEKAKVYITEAERAELEELYADDGEVEELYTDEAETEELDDTDEADIDIETEVNSDDYETEEYIAEECESEDCDSEGYEAEEVDYAEYEAAKGGGGGIEDYDSEQTEDGSPLPPQVVNSQHDDFKIQQPVAKKSNLNVSLTDTDNDNDDDYAESSVTVCPGCTKIYSYFTVDSNLDDIAEAVGDLNTAHFEVIVHPSELPGMNIDRAVEQFRQVLKCRNEIRAKMTGMINAHIAKMEADNKLTQASPAPPVAPKRVLRKPCSQCGKQH